MKKILIILFFITIRQITVAQVVRSHKLRLGAGKEWNTFLNPSKLMEDDEVLGREDLWDNGTYQAIALSNMLKIENGAHRFKFNVIGSAGIYQTEQNSNRYTFTLNGSYRLKYAPKRYVEISPEVYRKYRLGVNESDAVLRTSFSYLQVRVPVHLDFYLSNKTWLKTEFGYLSKNYDQPDDESLRYQAPFMTILLSKKWAADQRIRKLSFESQVQFRKYYERDRMREKFDEEDFEEEGFDDEVILFTEGARNWTYYLNDLTYSLLTEDKKRQIKFNVSHTTRIDRSRRNSYTEIGPGATLEYSLGKVDLLSGVQYSIRNYHQLSPGRENEILLKYQYLRLKLGLDVHIKERQTLYLKTNLVNRSSNNPNKSQLGFRDYFNGAVEMGVRLNF